MRAKRSAAGAHWIDPDHASAAAPTVPAGAELATEPVFQQLAYEAEALSIFRAARTPREPAEA